MKKTYLNPETEIIKVVNSNCILATSDDNYLENGENEEAGVKIDVESTIWNED